MIFNFLFLENLSDDLVKHFLFNLITFKTYAILKMYGADSAWDDISALSIEMRARSAFNNYVHRTFYDIFEVLRKLTRYCTLCKRSASAILLKFKDTVMSIVFLHWQHYNILVSENKISRKLQISCFQYIQRKVGQRTQRCIIFYLSQRDSYSHFQLRMQL